ncbi:MAG: ABC transporter permease subunit [Bauldia sp.]|nr:ABC transporter permease subunit [Bauldia sp.]
MAATAFRANPELAGTRVGFFRVLRAEWVKFRTLRSSYVILAIAVIILIGIWSLIAFGFSEAIGDADPGGDFGGVVDPLIVCMRSIGFAQLAIGVLGVTLVTNEYSTGMIRATLAAVPTRLPVLVAKAVLLIGVTMVVMVPSVIVALFIGDALLSGSAVTHSLSDPSLIRALVGAGLYLSLVGVLGMVFGWLLRSAAGAIFALVGVVLLLPVILPLIPLDWVGDVVDYLPTVAGEAVYQVELNPIMQAGMQQLTEGGMDFMSSRFEPWTGFGILAAYAVIGLVLSAWTLKRRDA